MQQRLMSRLAVGLLAIGALAGCGGDDDASGSSDTTSAASESAASADGSDELAFGDPCELVPPSDVGAIVGADVSAALVNVDDGLPGATCTYTVATGGSLSLSITPSGATFYGGYRDQAEAGDIEQVDGVGDDAFIFQDVEVVARHDTTMIQLQVFTAATAPDTGGVEIVRQAIAAIGG